MSASILSVYRVRRYMECFANPWMASEQGGWRPIVCVFACSFLTRAAHGQCHAGWPTWLMSRYFESAHRVLSRATHKE
jgi:hypothetical protein